MSDKMQIRYQTIEHPETPELRAIDLKLRDYNQAALGGRPLEEDYGTLAAKAYAPSGNMIGGIYGEIYWDWLHIRTFWVDGVYRGQGIGSKLLAQIEQAAREQGIRRFHLETTDFQALDFYLHQGYVKVGQLDNKPEGHTWYYLKKE